MKKIILAFVLFLSGMLCFGAHPFYVSICKVDFNNSNHSLEISLKIFADDLAMALKKNGAESLFLGEDKENPKTDDYILDYVQNHLDFTVDDKKFSYEYIGKEMEDDVVWIYLEVLKVSSLDEIEVNCNLLTEIFDSQSNIIQVNKDGDIKNILLQKGDTHGKIIFK